MPLSRIALLVAAAGLLAACGGGAAPASAPTSTLPEATTAPPPSTTTTVEPTTTAAPATTTTTVDPKAKVKADFLATREAFNQCVSDPATCDVSTISAPESTSHENLAAYFAQLARDGLRGRPSTEDYVVIEDVQLTGDGHTATMRTCTFDAGVLYDPRAPDDPSDDAIVNDAVGSTWTNWTLALVGDRWLRSSAEVTDDQVGVNTCPERASS